MSWRGYWESFVASQQLHISIIAADISVTSIIVSQCIKECFRIGQKLVCKSSLPYKKQTKRGSFESSNSSNEQVGYSKEVIMSSLPLPTLLPSQMSDHAKIVRTSRSNQRFNAVSAPCRVVSGGCSLVGETAMLM